MKLPVLNKSKSDKALYWLAIAVILFGIALRLMIFFKNNSLFIDEANVAQNIYDRNILQLFSPLDHNQHAPPGFLVILKLLSGAFGYSEYVLRLYPLLSGITALFLAMTLLRKYVSLHVLWYPIGIMAVGLLYIKYGAFLKQYSSDIVVTLSLILLALKYDILTTPAKRFISIWMLAGAVAIWFSMPSVFVLASVGIAYFIVLMRRKVYRALIPLGLISLFWLLNFAVYYNILLRYQVVDEYLMWWHQRFFLNPFPANAEEWEKNWQLIKQLFVSLGGEWTLSIVFHLSMMFLGAAYLLRKNLFSGLLIILPFVLCIIAVCMHKYTLLDRVMLFTFPLVLLMVAAGMQALFNLKSKVLNVIVIACGIICVVNFSELNTLAERAESEEIKRNLDFAVKWNVKGSNLYIHAFAVPAARYYIEIHPDKERYKTLKNPNYLDYNADFSKMGAAARGRTAMLYSWEQWDIMVEQMSHFEKYSATLAMNGVPGGWISVYERKDSVQNNAQNVK